MVLNFIKNCYSLIQNTHLEISVPTEEIKIVEAFEIFWPILRTRKSMSMSAKLIMHQPNIEANFPNDFFADPNTR